MDCSLPGSFVHRDSPGKNTGLVCHVFLQGLSQPRHQTQVSLTEADSLRSEPPGKPMTTGVGILLLLLLLLSHVSHVRLLATPWTVAYQAPPSMGFSRQEYWSGLPLPSPVGILSLLKISVRKSLIQFWNSMSSKCLKTIHSPNQVNMLALL